MSRQNVGVCLSLMPPDACAFRLDAPGERGPASLRCHRDHVFRMTGSTRFCRKRGRLGCNLAAGQEAVLHTHFFLLHRSLVFPSQSKWKVRVGKVVQQGSSEEGINRSRKASTRSNYLLVLSENFPTCEMVSHTDSSSALHLGSYAVCVLQCGVFRRIEAGPWSHV